MLIAGLVADSATTDARLSPFGSRETRPLILPTVRRYPSAGYSTEMPAISSAPRGVALLAALV